MSPIGRTAALCAALLLLLAACFAPVLRNGFVNYDDDVYVTANPMLGKPLATDTLRWAFTTFRASNWHPVTWLSHRADVALFGFDARGHHLTSLALHAANTLLLFLLLSRCTGAVWRSVGAAALFGIHPLHVESVAWVAERKDVLSTFFLLLTLLAYRRYLGGRDARSYAAVLLFFSLGLLAKPMLVTLPVLLLVLDFWPLGRWRDRRNPGDTLRRLLTEKAPLLALALLSGAVTLAAQARGGAVKTFGEYPFAERLGNALVSTARYLGKTLWPEGLVVFYPHPGGSLSAGTIALSALLLAAVTACVLLAAKRRPFLAAGWGWYLVTLSPVLGLVQIGAQAMADRYTYVPLAGLFVAALWGAADGRPRRRRRDAVLAAAVAALLLPLAAATRHQVGVWRDSVSVFEHALIWTRGNFVAHDNLATALLQQGREREALLHAVAALRIRPDREPGRYLRLGRALLAEGLYGEAAEVLEGALRMAPADQEAARLLAAARAGR